MRSHDYNSMHRYMLCTGALPLDPKLSVAVMGPNSDATTTMQGNYYVMIILVGKSVIGKN